MLSFWQTFRFLYEFLFTFHSSSDGPPEPFLSALQNIGVEFLHGVDNSHHCEVLFEQAAYNFLHAAKMHFRYLYLEFFLGICTKMSKKCQL